MSDTPGCAARPADAWRAFLDLELVRRLVREGLGCECPDAVFDDVVIGRPAVFPETAPRATVELLVGRRLLVSLVEVDHLLNLRADAELLLQRGRQARDAHGLNRFRLVLVGRCAASVIEGLAAHARAIDDRVHVHAVELETLAAMVGH